MRDGRCTRHGYERREAGSEQQHRLHLMSARADPAVRCACTPLRSNRDSSRAFFFISFFFLCAHGATRRSSVSYLASDLVVLCLNFADRQVNGLVLSPRTIKTARQTQGCG